MKKLTTLLIAIISLPVMSKQFGDWAVFEGSNYRFAKQDSRCTENWKQPVDFTYSPKKGWEFTFTTRFIADEVSILVDGQKFDFKPKTKAFHKMSWQINNELIQLIWDTPNPILIMEKHSNNGYSYCIASPKGSAAALRWVNDQ